MSLEQKLKSLKEREKEDLHSKIDSLETRYLTMPQKVNNIAELANMPAEQLVSICVEIAWMYKNFAWDDDIMEIVRSFYAVKKRREEEGK